MIHQFDGRWATYDGADSRDATAAEHADPDWEPTPRYWVPEGEVSDRLRDKGWTRGWLMGWRDIARATDERTVIFGIMPRTAVGHTCPLIFTTAPHPMQAALLANFNSLALDYVARQKVGGTHLTYGYLLQFPILPPSAYTEADLAFIVPRVLELTYTSHALAPFARDLGHEGPPFPWDEDRRARLRAELDAWYDRAYGLSRDELRYVLDPADTHGADYPSETFRVLKKNETARFGEYRTRRLVLQAWDALDAAARPDPATLPDGAWAWPGGDLAACTYVQLAALLKALPGPVPADRVRRAGMYALAPHRLTERLSGPARRTWRRLVGQDAEPRAGVIPFASTVDVPWREASNMLLALGRLLEDTAAGTWAPGAGLDQVLTKGWADGRARFVLDTMDAFPAEAALQELPVADRRWVDAGAA